MNAQMHFTAQKKKKESYDRKSSLNMNVIKGKARQQKDEEIAKALEEMFKRGVSQMKLVDHRGREKKRKMLQKN